MGSRTERMGSFSSVHPGEPNVCTCPHKTQMLHLCEEHPDPKFPQEV